MGQIVILEKVVMLADYKGGCDSILASKVMKVEFPECARSWKGWIIVG